MFRLTNNFEINLTNGITMIYSLSFLKTMNLVFIINQLNELKHLLASRQPEIERNPISTLHILLKIIKNTNNCEHKIFLPTKLLKVHTNLVNKFRTNNLHACPKFVKYNFGYFDSDKVQKIKNNHFQQQQNQFQKYHFKFIEQ